MAKKKPAVKPKAPAWMEKENRRRVKAGVPPLVWPRPKVAPPESAAGKRRPRVICLSVDPAGKSRTEIAFSRLGLQGVDCQAVQDAFNVKRDAVSECLAAVCEALLVKMTPSTMRKVEQAIAAAVDVAFQEGFESAETVQWLFNSVTKPSGVRADTAKRNALILAELEKLPGNKTRRVYGLIADHEDIPPSQPHPVEPNRFGGWTRGEIQKAVWPNKKKPKAR